MSKKIFVLDDEPTLRRDHVKQLKELLGEHDHFEVNELKNEAFDAGIDMLEARQNDVRAGKDLDKNTCCFDEAAVLIVESDLVPLRRGVSGEYVSYMARCFSNCGFILGVNQYGSNQFDLTLVGHPESFADLNIGSLQLANRGLWFNDWEGFRPWHWPLVSQACDALEKRSKELVGHLDDPILEYLQIPPEVSQLFPREVIEFIAPKLSLKNFHKVTFEQFLSDSRHGLQPKDAKGKVPESLKCRIAAARISKWIERLLLSGQEILIDAPHIASRLPSLIKSAELGIPSLNKTAKLGPPDELNLSDPDSIKSAAFRRSEWVSRPAWFWELIRRNEDILEVRDPWRRQVFDAEFCEDSSRFRPLSECREFQAKTPAADARRWVTRDSFPEVEYVPAVQFTL